MQASVVSGKLPAAALDCPNRGFLRAGGLRSEIEHATPQPGRSDHAPVLTSRSAALHISAGVDPREPKLPHVRVNSLPSGGSDS